MVYYRSVTADGEFEDVVDRVEELLAEEGFGVLCDIDVSATFEEKLDLQDYRNYRILGACNPELARESLELEPNLGVLLPCNVVVHEEAGASGAPDEVDEGGDVIVSAVDPETLLSVVDNEDLNTVAEEVDVRFDRVLEAVREENTEA